MKKIIGVLNPFDLYQTFYVYDDNQCISTFQTTIEALPEQLLIESKKYNINNIDISGSKTYVQGIINRITKAEIEKYSTHNLILNCI